MLKKLNYIKRKKMEDFKVRMLDEVCTLETKIHDLEKFITTADVFNNLSWKVRISTRLQLFFMRRYYFWLSQRIGLLCSQGDVEDYTNHTATPAEAEPVAELATEIVAKKVNKSKKKAKKKASNE